MKILMPRLPFFAILASGLISGGWNWLHTAHHPRSHFIVVFAVLALLIFCAYYGLKFFYRKAVYRIPCHTFWRVELPRHFDRLFFLASLFCAVLLIRNEWAGIAYALAVAALFAAAVTRVFQGHPHWPISRVVRTIGIASVVLFGINILLQKTASELYVFEVWSALPHVPLFRALSMTALWVGLFALAGVLATFGRRWSRAVSFGTWFFLFAAVMFVWVINIGVLYFSGLYFNPTALLHAEGANSVIWNNITYISLAGYALCVFFIARILWTHTATHHATSPRFLRSAYGVVLFVAIVVVFGIQSVQATPEFAIMKSFYRFFQGDILLVDMPEKLAAKLERFGLSYKLDQFLVGTRDRTYTNEKDLLPKQFEQKPPNIIIVFLESYSSRLTSLYNNQYQDVTPGLEMMAKDPNTTVFHNYYNASTPTINGLISQLCSFLPPTGHEEIAEQKTVKELRLRCLPQILKEDGSYQYTSYITAVGKGYASKDTILTGAGVDEIYGTDELKQYIKGEQLSWGFSDHQLFPAMTDIIKDRAKEPFFVALSTVDTHPPFTLAKDMVKWGNGKSDILNSVHTTDDAFRIFWEQFETSPLYDNTIVVAVADHAIFPSAVTKNLYPDVAGKLSFYDENTFLMYVPNSMLPEKVETYASGLDFAPTLLHMLKINASNSFEGHSIFDDREKYPNLIGIHEFGLYANQMDEKGNRTVINGNPTETNCPATLPDISIDEPLTLCELEYFFRWQRQMFEQGRLWSE